VGQGKCSRVKGFFSLSFFCKPRLLYFGKHWTAVIHIMLYLMCWKGQRDLSEQRMEPVVETCHFWVTKLLSTGLSESL
jgi:hypothetical protein